MFGPHSAGGMLSGWHCTPRRYGFALHLELGDICHHINQHNALAKVPAWQMGRIVLVDVEGQGGNNPARSLRSDIYVSCIIADTDSHGTGDQSGSQDVQTSPAFFWFRLILLCGIAAQGRDGGGGGIILNKANSRQAGVVSPAKEASSTGAGTAKQWRPY